MEASKDHHLFNKVLFIISISTSCFILFMYLNSTIFHSDFVLIGVFRELLTLPSLLSQPVLMILAGRSFDLSGRKIKSYSFLTILISTATFLILAKSFS